MTNPDITVLAGLLREGLEAGHMPFLTVTSGSMAPLLRIGDQIGLQPVALELLSPGDVVAVQHQALILTHRFCGLQTGQQETKFVTRGDRSRSYDQPWSEEQLLGRVVVRRRGQQKLWLDFGAGRWLNHSLARAARVEQKLMDGWRPARIARQPSLSERLVHLTFRAYATALTRVVEKAT